MKVEKVQQDLLYYLNLFLFLILILILILILNNNTKIDHIISFYDTTELSQKYPNDQRFVFFFKKKTITLFFPSYYDPRNINRPTAILLNKYLEEMASKSKCRISGIVYGFHNFIISIPVLSKTTTKINHRINSKFSCITLFSWKSIS